MNRQINPVPPSTRHHAQIVWDLQRRDLLIFAAKEDPRVLFVTRPEGVVDANGETPRDQIVIVQNWFEELKRLVPVDRPPTRVISPTSGSS